MDAITVINELLYIISTYEKGKVDVGNFWRKKHYNLFLESINVIELLLEVLRCPEHENLTKKILPVITFIDKNTNVIFPESKGLALLRNGGLEFDLHSEDTVSSHRDVINQMNIIIQKCKTEKKKKNAFYLLMAFHNLPRVFLKSNLTPLFSCYVTPISSREALEIATIWTNKAQ